MSATSLVPAIIGLVVVSGAGLAFVALVERFVARSSTAAAVLLVVSVVLTFLDGWPGPLVVGGFTITADDVLFSGMFVAALLRLLRAPSVTTPQRLLLGLVSLTLLSTVRGTAIHGLGPAVNEMRDFFFYLAGALYFSTTVLTPAVRERIGVYLVRAAAAIAALVLLRWAALGFVAPGTELLTRSEEGGIRVVNSRDALLLAQVGLLLAPLWFRRELSRGHRWLFALLLAQALLLQHRTVWLAIVGGVAAMLVADPALGRRISQAVMVSAAIIGVVIVVLIGTEESPVPQSPVDPNTIAWRYEGWAALVGQDIGGTQDLLLGRPMGDGYERKIRSYTVDVTPHNYYLQVFLRLGAVGLAMFVALLAYPARRLRGGPRHAPDVLAPGMMRVLLVMQWVFFITWKPDSVQGIVLGLILATAAPARPPSRLPQAHAGATPEPDRVLPLAHRAP